MLVALLMRHIVEVDDFVFVFVEDSGVVLGQFEFGHLGYWLITN